MKNVFFEPFVGEQYDKGYLGKKILVLGDSHYCNDMQEKPKCVEAGACTKLPECNEFTVNFVNYFLEYKEGVSNFGTGMNSYTKFTNVFLKNKGEPVSNKEVLEFWNSIIFYNYVQTALEKSRKNPIKKEYDDSQDAFFEVLEEFKPDLVIVWGWRLDQNLPQKNRCQILDETKPIFKVYFDVAGKKIPVFSHPHPSSGFGYEYHSKLQEAVRLA